MQITSKFFNYFFGLLFLAVLTFLYSNNRIEVDSKEKNKKSVKTNEQELKPILDGFVAQASGNFSSSTTAAELKKATGFSREIYLTYDFSDLTITAKSATLKVFCEFFDKFGDITISAYCLPEYQTSSLTWATRPTLPNPVSLVSINQSEHLNTTLEFDVSSSLTSILNTTSKRATFVLKITDGNDALLKFSTSESISNVPSILLSDEDPTGGGTNSSIKLPTIFGDNMVLQRDQPIKIWGEVLPNLPVVINFGGEEYTTQCNSSGKFSTTLPAKSASSSIFTLSISSNNETRLFSNIVMGDVYLCGGQSNMAMLVSGSKPDQLINAKADGTYPNLRFFEVAKIVSGGVLINANDKPWRSALPDRVVSWSAVAFFVGRDLHKHLNIPIGLINVSHGGAPTDAFISPEAYANDPILNAAKRAKATGIYDNYQTPSSLYNSMISKVAGYPIKAVLWYQAEANASAWQNYKVLLKGLIKDWRTQFNNSALPWLFVQLPGFDVGGDTTKMTWAETRDIQLQVWKEDPNTNMAVTIDLGEKDNIHPTDKYTVAKRMLPQVRALVYGEQITHKSPIYKSHVVEDADVFVSFDNLGSGLKAVKEITEFQIAGSDKVFKNATATLLPDNKIKLTNSTISAPLYVRYAFLNFTTVSIYTKDDLSLPLSPFKSELPTKEIAGTEIPFSSIENAYASSSFADRLPINAVNGSGLNGNGHDASTVNGISWHSNGDVVFPNFFKIELKSPQDLSAMKIWNLNWTSTFLIRGVKDIEIYVSESSANLKDVAYSDTQWKKVMNYTMNQASGNNNYAGEYFTFPQNQLNVKWVGINIVNSYNSANTFCGISEIKLYKDDNLDTANFEKNNTEIRLILHPNPSNGVINIEKNGNPKLIFVYDVSGKLVYKQKFNTKIELTFLKKGFYFIKTDLNQTSKLIIE